MSLATTALVTAAAHAQEADSGRRLAPEVVAELTATGLARHFVPRRWGGREGTFTDLLHEAAAVGEACTSAAWVAMLWAVHGRYAALLPEEGQQRVWGASPDVRISAALMPPAGQAEPAPDGWRLTGTWGCVSGVDSAEWMLAAAPGTTGRRGCSRCRAPASTYSTPGTPLGCAAPAATPRSCRTPLSRTNSPFRSPS